MSEKINRTVKAVDVVGLGLNAMDTICVVDRFPKPHTKSPIREVRVEPGGQVATAMAACTRFGLSTRYIGSVGSDDVGKSQLQSLRDSGLNTDDVVVVEGAKTQFAIILLEEGVGERTILWHHDPKLNCLASHITREMIVSGKLLHLDGCDTEAALKAAHWAKQAGIPVVIDIDEMYDESTPELLRNVDYLIASEDFAQRPAEEAVVALADRYGSRVVGVTCGEHGAVMLENGRMFHSPGFMVDVLDTTGAGDVFHGAFIYGLLKNWNLEDTARFANAAAALKCTKIGARCGIPSLEDALRLAKTGAF